MQTSAPNSGDLVAGRFRLDTVVARGGFGDLWHAEQLATGQRVVIKLLRPELGSNPAQVERFAREARALARLSHPNTVRVIDHGEADDGVYWLALERLHGRDLAAAVDDNGGRLGAARLLPIAVQTLAALEEAHQAGIVHRDLKPHNIFLVDAPNVHDFVKVIDFGVATSAEHADDPRLTETGRAVGTPLFMSPEQIQGGAVDGRSDLYALGVVLYQCLSGQPPFAGRNPMQTMLAHLHRAAQPLRALVPDLPDGLHDAVMKVLAKEPRDRFQTAAEMRVALQRIALRAWQPATPAEPASLTLPLAAAATVPDVPRPGRLPRTVRAGLGGAPTDLQTARHKLHRVRVTGSGPQTVVLVHALERDADTWDALVAELAGEFRVVTFDLPGCGPHGGETFDADLHATFEGLADSALQLLRETVAPPWTWLGHGVGGNIGVLAAHHAPQLLERVVLTSALPTLCAIDDCPGIGPEVAAGFEARAKAACSAWTAGLGGFRPSEFDATGLPFRLEVAGMRPDIGLHYVRLVLGVDHRAAFAGLPVPLACVFGDGDPFVAAAGEDWLVRHCHGLQSVRLGVGGRAPHETDPAAFAAAVRQLLRPINGGD